MNQIEGKLQVTDISDRNAWLFLRQKYICASDVPALFGMGFRSAVDIYMEKIGEGEQKDNWYMKHGRELEPFLAEQASQSLGQRVTLARQFCTKGILGCTPDAFAEDGAPVQLKATAGYQFDDWIGEVPAAYHTQVMTELAVLDKPHGYLFLWSFGKEPVVYKVTRSESAIEGIQSRAEYFMNNYVLLRRPPLDEEFSYEDVSKVYPEGRPEEITLDESALHWIEHYQEGKRLAEQAEQIIDLAKAKLAAMMKENSVATINGFKLSWKTVKSNRVDTDRLKREFADIYQTCIKESSSRRFTLTEKEGE